MKKAWNIIKTVLVWLVVAAAVAMMVFTIVSVTTFDRDDRALFGYKAFIVRSDSMAATDFDAGDLILVKEVDPATLQVGDIIAFRSTDSSNFGETVTHKIRQITTNAEGEPCFITYGTSTNTDDTNPVTYSHVLGKYEGRLAGVGNFFAFLKTTPGYICCIFLPFALLIVVQVISTVRLFRQYRAEQMDEIKSEREALAAEREESRRMMEELQALKAQLSAQAEETPNHHTEDDDNSI